MNAVAGGHFPLPSAVAHLMSLLPPPECFHVSRFQMIITLAYVHDFTYKVQFSSESVYNTPFRSIDQLFSQTLL